MYKVQNTFRKKFAECTFGAVETRASKRYYVIDGINLSYDAAMRYLQDDGMTSAEAHHYLSCLRKEIC